MCELVTCIPFLLFCRYGYPSCCCYRLYDSLSRSSSVIPCMLMSMHLTHSLHACMCVYVLIRKCLFGMSCRNKSFTNAFYAGFYHFYCRRSCWCCCFIIFYFTLFLLVFTQFFSVYFLLFLMVNCLDLFPLFRCWDVIFVVVLLLIIIEHPPFSHYVLYPEFGITLKGASIGLRSKRKLFYKRFCKK